MSKHFEIGEMVDGKPFRLPADAVTQTFAVLAKRRVGKTYTASVIAEEMVAAGQPFVALDPTGAWWGLRANESGKPNGSPVIIIGGQRGDVPLEPTAGKVIAELVVENPGQYVVDLSGTNSNAEQDRFVADFAERLYRLKDKHKSPLHLFLDEADSFAPQRPSPGQLRMLGAIEALVRRGGIRGIGVSLITQRPAILNKNVLTQTECLIVLQITAPQDIDAIDDWVKNNATREERETVVSSLASLPCGRAWFWSPGWLSCLVQVNVRKRTTFNSSATPEVGKTTSAIVTLAPADIAKIRDKVAATIEKAKADDPNELKRQIAELKKQAKYLTTAPPVKVETKVEFKELPALNNKQIFMMAEFCSTISKLEMKLPDIVQLIKTGRALADDVHTVHLKIDALRKGSPPPRPAAMATHAPPTARPPRPALAPRSPLNATGDESNGDELDGAQQKIINTIAMLGMRSLIPNRDMVARWMDLHPSGGRYGTNLAFLREHGYLAGCELTEKGHTVAQVMPTGFVACKDPLDGSQREILDVLAGGESFTRDTLAEALNLHPSGGRYGTNLARLRTMGLIPERGEIKLTEAANL